MHHYACAILLRDGEILLGKRAAHRRAYANCWDVIGGRVEAGETLEAALARELGEELGIKPLAFPLAFTFLSRIYDDNPGGRGGATYAFFVVDSWLGEPEMRNNEHSELRWFAPEAACSLSDLALAEYRTLFRNLQKRSS